MALKDACSPDKHQFGPFVCVLDYDPPFVSLHPPRNPDAAGLRAYANNCHRAANHLETLLVRRQSQEAL